jgi:hypothetical protein
MQQSRTARGNLLKTGNVIPCFCYENRECHSLFFDYNDWDNLYRTINW